MAAVTGKVLHKWRQLARRAGSSGASASQDGSGWRVSGEHGTPGNGAVGASNHVASCHQATPIPPHAFNIITATGPTVSHCHCLATEALK